MTSSSGLNTIVWTTRETCASGTVFYDPKGVTVLLDSGTRILESKSSGILFSVKNEVILNAQSKKENVLLKNELRVFLKPLLRIVRGYTPDGSQIMEDVFPPSSHGFYGRMRQGKKKCLYVVQTIENDTHFWLTIVDLKSGEIFESHMIQPYEVDSISMFDQIETNELQLNHILSSYSDSLETELYRILDEPSPSWSDLAALVEEIQVPNLHIGINMQETLAQLIPDSFPTNVRDELMVFLALVVKGEIPGMDPVEFFSNLFRKPVLRGLLMGHYGFLLDKIQGPPYVKLMVMAAQKSLSPPKRTHPESTSETPWKLFWQKCIELFPDWRDIAFSYVRDLNESSQIVTRLPVSKTDAKRSKQSWKKRLALLASGLRLIGVIEPQAVGLQHLAYIGAAYRWPHRHMKFIARLGPISDNPPHMQVMLMPVSAKERVERILPSIVNIDWTARKTNLDLFNQQSKSWAIPTSRILDSISKRVTFRKLGNRYGRRSNNETYSLSEMEAKTLDLVGNGVFLASLELQEYNKYWGITSRNLSSILNGLRNRGIVRVHYDMDYPNLVSLAIIAQGQKDHVCSLVNSLLQNTPTCSVMLGDDYETALIISRIPEESIQDITSLLPRVALENNIQLRCLVPRAFRSFQSAIHQRLLKDDNTWDDDVSAFLSQARSKRKELSESNA